MLGQRVLSVAGLTRLWVALPQRWW
eukprot:COSAG02_NODE_20646_length_821_cov_1.037396_1_plen_24_part_10